MALQIRERREEKYDLAALGEVALGLDAGEGRVRCAPMFQVAATGDGFDVAQALSRCFGLTTTVVTALADNAVGRLLTEHIRRGGLDLSHVKWVSDTAASPARNSVLFSERGLGLRAHGAVVDNLGAVAALLRPYDIDWNRLFAHEGVRWFHTDSGFAMLSETSLQTTLAAVRAAKRSGAVVSLTVPDRPGNPALMAQRDVYKDILRTVDVVIGASQRLAADCGLDAEDPGDGDVFARQCAALQQRFPNIALFARPRLRLHAQASCDWMAEAWDGRTLHRSTGIERLAMCDTSGSLAAFGAGLVYGLLSHREVRTALEYGIALGALAMGTPHSPAMADQEEVEAVVRRLGQAIPGQAPRWSLVEWSSGEW